MFEHAMDEMEERVAKLKEQEDIDAIRPDLNGDEIMAELGIAPGPLVARRTDTCLNIVSTTAPVDHDTAVAELHNWYASQAE